MQLKEAMVRKFKASPEYQQLRNDRQRDSSLEVLKFIAGMDLEPVRRCTIRRAFTVGGKDRFRYKDKEALTDRELQRILDRLVAARCLIRHESVPTRMAAKGRKKPDVYYDLNVIGVSQACVSKPKDLENYDRVFGMALSRLDGRTAMLSWAREELVKNNWKKMSDEHLVRMIEMLGQLFHKTRDHEILRWAEGLPDDEAPLKVEILRYVSTKVNAANVDVMMKNCDYLAQEQMIIKGM